LFDFDFLGKQL